MTEGLQHHQSGLEGEPVYRTLQTSDLPAGQALSTLVGWAHRLEDWQFSAATGIGFVAEEAGQIIGIILCWKFGTESATLGQVIVSPSQQGRGIGRKLVELVLAELSTRTIFLHATAAGRPLYEKLGFRQCAVLEQFQGNLSHVRPLALPAGTRLRPAEPPDHAGLISMCDRATGLAREHLLTVLLGQAKAVVLERDGRNETEILGWSVLRRFGRGYVIGPVIAQRAPAELYAKALIAYWLPQHLGQFMRIDIPMPSDLGPWLEEQGMPLVERHPKMVLNAPPEHFQHQCDPAVGVFGLVSHAMF